MLRIAVAAAIALFAASPVSAMQPDVVPLTVAQGLLAGTHEEDIAVFKNIPFAAPPVGPLRWRAPQPAPSWTGVRAADRFGPACPQAKGSLFRRLLMPQTEQSEDCLSLNVWTSRPDAGAKLPVMVFIYGGSFVTGSASFPLYDGTDLAKHGVVVVTLNYRLGALGFFDHPALAAESPQEPTGNYGLMDQIAALEWVKRNIAAFGGDASNVTIFGESAGGMSVNDLMVSPRARGLFAKAISESGLGFNLPSSTGTAQAAAKSFAELSGARGDDAAALARLRSLSTSEIIKQQAQVAAFRTIGPIIDGMILPEIPSIAFAKGQIAKVPYMAGSNSNEATLMDALGTSKDDLLRPLGDPEDAVRKVYEEYGPLADDAFTRRLFDDAWFAAPAQALAQFATGAGAPAYVYQFAYLTEQQRKDGADGVMHGGELAYVFGLRGLLNDPFYGSYVKAATANDLSVVARVQAYWTNFAKSGNPNGDGLPQWDATAPASPKTLVIDNDGTKTVAGFRKAQLSLIDAAWSKYTRLPAPN